MRTSRPNNVTVQISPFRAGAHSGIQGGFHVLRFREAIDRDVVYFEYFRGAPSTWSRMWIFPHISRSWIFSWLGRSAQKNLKS
ncbi:Scr1 family TA system antitoxin-like transcriptional regulator [Acrocarpospora pleiomorpha]|uniref:Scr1 family TA system antitoxin-like transcriptional regulator n=1 Tax=Acrocarpospora pleiomorpha TaxID=90975 RepID=UPI0035A23099